MKKSETISLGGGCFWCTEAVYRRVKGVISVTPGYAGGDLENPTYEDVIYKQTGHAEVVKVVFDPIKISLCEILEIFWKIHDPTSPNRQGNDVGSQYRSMILYTNEKQRQIIKNSIHNLEEEGLTIVTEVKKLQRFYDAEIGHAEYYEKNRSQPYCRFVIDPKIKKLRNEFKSYVKK